MSRALCSLLLLCCLAPAAWAQDTLDAAVQALSSCDPSLVEAQARLRAAQEELAAAQLQSLLELRGSYFYYPNANLAGDDLNGVQQRADLYLRYPLLSRLRTVPQQVELQELQVREEQVRLEAALASARARLADHYLGLTRERRLTAQLQEALERSRERVDHLRALWEDKLILLEDVLEEEVRLADLELDLARSRAREEAQRGAVRELVCSDTWEPASLPTGVVSIPRELPDTAADTEDPWAVRAEREQRLADRSFQDLRLDLEGGYTWEEDENQGLQDGPRVGFRFVVPLSFGRERERAKAAHLAQRDVWLARSRASRGQGQTASRELLREAEQLHREEQVLKARERLLDERRRVRDLRGDSFSSSRDRADLALRRWQIYFRAWEIASRLPHAETATPEGEAPYRFVPPDSAASHEPEPRKRPARSVYAWGGPESLGSLAEFLEFARAKGIGTLYLSPAGKPLDPGTERWSELLRGARQAGIEVHLLLGENNWARPGQRQGLARRLAEYTAFQRLAPVPFAGLHLDVEPHALPEWPERRDELVAAFVALAQEVRDTLGRSPEAGVLSLSIPHWLGPKLTAGQRTALARAADRLALMCYDTFRDETLLQSFAAWGDNPAVQLELALRASDFPTETALDRAIHRYRDLLPAVPRPAIHDLAGWRRLAQASGVP